MEEYTVKISENAYQDIVKKIRQRYFKELGCEINLKDLPHDSVRIQDEVITFHSDDIRHDVMYAFVTECLVKKSDLVFFLMTASSHVMLEYCRSFWYKRGVNERCLFLPNWPQNMYVKHFIDKLNFDILNHCELKDEKMQSWITERCKYDYSIDVSVVRFFKISFRQKRA
jgi:hypothetical protein